MTFSEFIQNEAKQVGTIYHFTTLHNFVMMLEETFQTELGCEFFDFVSYNGYISTTRDRHLSWSNEGYNNNRSLQVRIAIDGDKLSNKHKIVPVNGLTTNDPDIFGNDKLRVPHKSEKEELICPVNNKINLRKYILGIQIIYDDKVHLTKEDIEYKLNSVQVPFVFVNKFKGKV